MTWHGYILISNLPPGWTNEQRHAAWNGMRRIGRQSSPISAWINHTRESLDGRELLVEAEFEEMEITREAIVAVIANEAGIAEAAVDAIIDYEVFAEGGTWDESQQAAEAYIDADRAAWEDIETVF